MQVNEAMPEKNHCPHCGRGLPGGAPAGLCPAWTGESPVPTSWPVPTLGPLPTSGAGPPQVIWLAHAPAQLTTYSAWMLP